MQFTIYVVAYLGNNMELVPSIADQLVVQPPRRATYIWSRNFSTTLPFYQMPWSKCGMGLYEFHCIVELLELCICTLLTTLNMIFSVRDYLELHITIFFHYNWCIFYQVKLLLFYSVQTIDLTFVGKLWHL